MSDRWVRSKGRARVFRACGILTAFVGVLFLLTGLFGEEVRGNRGVMIATAVALLALSIFPLRLGVAGVRYDEHRVVVRNVFNEWTIGWPAIESFGIGRYSFFPFVGQVHLRNGEIVPIWGIAPPDIAPQNKRTARLIDQLNRALLEHLAMIDGGDSVSMSAEHRPRQRHRRFARPRVMWLWLGLWVVWQIWELIIQRPSVRDTAFVLATSAVFAGLFYLRVRLVWIVVVVLNVADILLVAAELVGLVQSKYSVPRMVGELALNAASLVLALTPEMRRLFFSDRRHFAPYRKKHVSATPIRPDTVEG